MAIPKPNPTWVSGSSSSGITVEETGTITLSAVPASLSMLYRVGPAATEARRAAKTSRCILAGDLTLAHTVFLSLCNQTTMMRSAGDSNNERMEITF